ncbi:GNAT family N-acetyltransferase [Bacillus sp. AK031]
MMNLYYEVIPTTDIACLRESCNELMAFQKSVAHITPELFDEMNFDTRLLPSVKNALHNYAIAVKDGDLIVGYVYSNVSPKDVYSNEFATFFDMDSVDGDLVGCLSQFYLKAEYRKYGVGSVLFNMSMEWLKQFEEIEDYFIFVSNGNENALKFYLQKGFIVSHDILDGFITVLRSTKEKLATYAK